MKALNLAIASLAFVFSASGFASSFNLQVKKCARIGEDYKSIQCVGIVRNSAAESSDDLIVPSLFRVWKINTENENWTTLYSYEGDAVKVSSITFGSKKMKSYENSVFHRVPGKLPVKFSVVFDDAPKSIEAVARIDFVVRPDKDNDVIVASAEDIAID